MLVDAGIIDRLLVGKRKEFYCDFLQLLNKMKNQDIKVLLDDYIEHLKSKDLSENTKKRYTIDTKQFLNVIDYKISAESMLHYEKYLKKRFKPSTVNVKIISVNLFLLWAGYDKFRMKSLKIQKRTYSTNTFTVLEINHMLKYAAQHRPKMYHIMSVITFTGIRVGELEYVTVEALREGHTIIDNKGKYRDVCLPRQLCLDLLEYCEIQQISSGYVFEGRTRGKPISTNAVWKNLQFIAKETNIKKEKAHPHNLRHFFAREFLKQTGDIIALADILGHNSINTTRIYTKRTMSEFQDILESVSDSWKLR